MKSFNVAFSGACHSGKTTTIDKLKEIFKDDAVVLGELVRDTNIVSIDDIRKDPERHFSFEKEVIQKKIDGEDSLRNVEDKICLIDRCLTDSLHYLLDFTKPEELGEESRQGFNLFVGRVSGITRKHLEDFYDVVLLCQPIPPNGMVDKFRPRSLTSEDQRKEYNRIIEVTKSFISEDPEWEGRYKFNRLSVIGNNLVSDFANMIQNKLIQSKYPFKSYADYKNSIEEKFFVPNNIIMNRYGAIEYRGQNIKTINFSALLYTDNKPAADEIINTV
ncbi:MAG: AAA family ATPase [bacterium]